MLQWGSLRLVLPAVIALACGALFDSARAQTDLPSATTAQNSAAKQVAVDLELVLAVDVSLSIDSREALLQRQGYVEAFRDPLVVEAIGSGILGRMSVLYFEWANSAHTQLIVDWMLIDSPASAAAFAAALERRRPGPAHYTSISGAIDFAAALFDSNGYDGTRQVIDVSGDGPNNWGDLVNRARDRAVAQGVTINGLPILDRNIGPFSRYNIANLDLYYRDCVIGGPASFIVVAENFEAFASAIRRKLILEIAGLHPLEAPFPGYQPAQAIDGDARVSPPCDIGEQLLRSRVDDF
ncbi:MAG: DUF1194 domain-containing protein [Kiloniellaceae bacterium]